MDDSNALLLLETAIAHLREIDSSLDGIDAGVCALHLEACIASLESRIRDAKSGARPLSRRQREIDSPVS